VDQYADFFRWLTGFGPYPYQRRVAAVLLGRSAALKAELGDDVAALERTLSTQLAGQRANVVLQAPTGAGKTWAAVVPLIFSGVQGDLIADRLLYAVPLRTLAENLYESTKEKLRERNLQDLFPVRLQTGETTAVPGVGDPSFAEGRIIFCTIDQVLSSYLNIPFGLSARQANLNAGALVGSLLVLDEYHLLDPDRSLQTALLLSRHLLDLTGIVWMTATQAGPARRRLWSADRANAVPVSVPAEEVAEIVSQRGKKRRWFWQAERLNAEYVWRKHQTLPPSRRRSLVVCNTVHRSQEVYGQIRAIAPPSVAVRLLHSRFLSQHRAEMQRIVAQALAQGSNEEMILVATQVVEAGLDLSATCLHTELAPANALVQRAGRCARFEGEDGTVIVYDSLDATGTRSYEPYAGGEPGKALSEENAGSPVSSLRRAMDTTAVEVARLSGDVVSFPAELGLIDRVHTNLDLGAIESFDSREWRRQAAKAITPTPDHSNYALAADLIRDIDSVSVFLADEERLNHPEARLAPRYRPAAVSVPRKSLAGLSKSAAKHAGIWAMQAPRYTAAERGDGFCGYEVIAEAGGDYKTWLLATYRSGLLALNPVLARYTRELGLELGVMSQPGDWQSTGLLSFDSVGQTGSPDHRYQAERFEEHTNLVRLHATALCGREGARDYLMHERSSRGGGTFELTDHRVGLMRLDTRYELPPGTAASLALLSAALHDAGKLAVPWQEAVWRWQALKASSRAHYPDGPNGTCLYQAARHLLEEKDAGQRVLLAHTDYDGGWRWPDGRQESDIEREFARPNHALEGAWIALPFIAERLDRSDLPSEQLAKAVLAAISQHHSPGSGLGAVVRSRPVPVTTTVPGADEALRAAVGVGTQVRLEDEQPSHWAWESFLIVNVRFDLRPGAGSHDDWDWWPLAMVLVRVVRLADQQATGLAGPCQNRED